VVVEIIKDSIKVRSSEGRTQRFNANRLKTLYAPPDRSEPSPPQPEAPPTKPDRAADPIISKPELPPRVYIADPDFTSPVRPIHDYAKQPDFPQCAYGKQVDIVGYVGVVVEIVKGSLRVQSASGTSRNYNAEVLKKLHGKA
jgi:hypothetical protein